MGGNIDTSNKEGKWKREISRGNRQHGVLEGPDSFSRAYVCALYIFAPCNRTCVYIYIYICIHVYIYIYIYIYTAIICGARIYNDWRRRGGTSAGTGSIALYPVLFFRSPGCARVRFSSLTARGEVFPLGRRASLRFAVRR